MVPFWYSFLSFFVILGVTVGMIVVCSGTLLLCVFINFVVVFTLNVLSDRGWPLGFLLPPSSSQLSVSVCFFCATRCSWLSLMLLFVCDGCVDVLVFSQVSVCSVRESLYQTFLCDWNSVAFRVAFDWCLTCSWCTRFCTCRVRCLLWYYVYGLF